MSKPKMSVGERSVLSTKRSFSCISKAESVAVVAGQASGSAPTSLLSGTINVRQMAEDAAKMQEYIANGGKKSELSGVKFIKQSGLFDSRGVGR
ncbi:hypothetical protein GO755_18620 [Spirosoma sp. HMF4905]|uniref:Uncharacterized protein n=1 Tax=Spirosoma arboris TaxID=2682092 RepID=A0A7K1SE48_9BACT|nr:hypothetical protein [Spirosoma arboris]MVM32070.1 hypothetical protein [Spirosoma arboris]